MSDAGAHTCDYDGCSKPGVRRCYFCEHSFCPRHFTVANGAICGECADR